MAEAKTPSGFWVAAVLLLVWNLMGLMALGYDGMLTDEAIAQMPAATAELYRLRPGWVVVAFASAVFSGTAAAVALLARKRVAVPLFLLSLVSVLVQDSWFIIGGVLEVMGPGALVMPALVIASILVGIGLGRRGIAGGWIG